MYYSEDRLSVSDLKVAFIGGGSVNWARILMSDLALEEGMSGTVYLYDINYEYAKQNEKIGALYTQAEGAVSTWKYKAVETLKEALIGADFVFISIQPGPHILVKSDMEVPEKYGIYQTVGDTTGPGGLVKALRAVPMFKEFAEGVRDYCPNAWVINYSNPMTMLTAALYEYFPKIKAIGCCHEVFGGRGMISFAYEDIKNVQLKFKEGYNYNNITANVVGINHFTWITDAYYGTENVWDVYAQFVDKYRETGYGYSNPIWIRNGWVCGHKVKFDLFKRYNVIAAAGDKHLCEFCPKNWYLKDRETAKEQWLLPFFDGNGSYFHNWFNKGLERNKKIISGEEKIELKPSGEEGMKMMKAFLGIAPFTTNVNYPNVGQIPNMPLGYVVETNASLDVHGVHPVASGNIPLGVDTLVQRVAGNYALTLEAAIGGNYELAYKALVNDPLVDLSLADSRKMFEEMLANTKDYLPYYKG